jgi:hypothetical protein
MGLPSLLDGSDVLHLFVTGAFVVSLKEAVVCITVYGKGINGGDPAEVGINL